jgi:methylmalonyl-CoA/ethylmalonyl-CoA epimerase
MDANREILSAPFDAEAITVRLDHIGIAVRSIDTAVEVYRLTGFETGMREIVADQGVEVQILPAGEAHLELIQPIRDDSPVVSFLEKRGEGLHHIALKVNDINGVLNRLKARGIRLIDEEPRIGAGGHRIAFVHPRSTGGVLIELVED